jgi:hypothetical protein
MNTAVSLRPLMAVSGLAGIAVAVTVPLANHAPEPAMHPNIASLRSQ